MVAAWATMLPLITFVDESSRFVRGQLVTLCDLCGYFHHMNSLFHTLMWQYGSLAMSKIWPPQNPVGKFAEVCFPTHLLSLNLTWQCCPKKNSLSTLFACLQL